LIDTGRHWRAKSPWAEITGGFGFSLSFSICSVHLHQDGEDRPKEGFAEWMPYQKSVAKGETAPTLHA
jgi:hypothetical protein